MKEKTTNDKRAFCRAYLQCMDAGRAAEETCGGDGFELLGQQGVKKYLERARNAAADEIRREDVIRRLCALAFGKANDGVKLAYMQCVNESIIDKLDLSCVAEFKRNDKGAEIKFVDRVKALETLYGLLGSDGDSTELDALFDALEGGMD